MEERFLQLQRASLICYCSPQKQGDSAMKKIVKTPQMPASAGSNGAKGKAAREWERGTIEVLPCLMVLKVNLPLPPIDSARVLHFEIPTLGLLGLVFQQFCLSGRGSEEIFSHSHSSLSCSFCLLPSVSRQSLLRCLRGLVLLAER